MNSILRRFANKCRLAVGPDEDLFYDLIERAVLYLDISTAELAHRFGVGYKIADRWMLRASAPHKTMRGYILRWVAGEAQKAIDDAYYAHFQIN